MASISNFPISQGASSTGHPRAVVSSPTRFAALLVVLAALGFAGTGARTATSAPDRRAAPPLRRGLIGSGSAPAAGRAYRDVPAHHPAAPAIRGLLSRGILVRKPGASFRGDQPVTRYELAVALYRMVRYLEPERTGGGSAGNVNHGGSVRDAKLPKDPVRWLIERGYLASDTQLAHGSGTTPVSTGLLSDSLAYIADRVLLHRPMPYHASPFRPSSALAPGRSLGNGRKAAPLPTVRYNLRMVDHRTSFHESP